MPKNTKKTATEKLVTKAFVTARGNEYQLPTKYFPIVSVSAVIRGMIADGFTRYQISKITGIRYQMVRNILEQGVKK